jgi:hypothetical protein
MKNCLKVLIPLLLLVLLAACAAQIAKPTPTDAPRPTRTPRPTATPLPTVDPEWPEQAIIVAEFYKAWSEDRADDALSYLADDVRLEIGRKCFSAEYARALLKNMIEDPILKSVYIVKNYQIDGDIVNVYIKEFNTSGNFIDVASEDYVVIDGLIQWQEPCQPEE